MAVAEAKSMRIEGSLASISVDRSTGSFSILEKSGEKEWAADPWLNAAGMLVVEDPQSKRREINISRSREITIEKQGEQRISFSFKGLQTEGEGFVDGEVLTSVSLTDDGASFRVEVADVRLPEGWNFVELEYPCRLGALRTDVDQGYLVIPNNQGTLVPSTTGAFKKVPRVTFWAWDDGPWTQRGCQDLQVYGHTQVTMPFYGCVDGSSTLVAILETENDSFIRCVLNSNYQQFFDVTMQMSPYSRLAVCSPVWKSEKKTFGYPRAMTYSLLRDADFNGVAKHYRQHAQKSGLVVTLREKIEATPQLDTIIGGPFIQLDGGYPWYIDYPIYRYTWADVRTFVDFLKTRLKMDRAMLCLWIGYQNYPPDSYPFHPAQGTVDELKSVIAYARDRNVLICFYHGYPSLLDHASNCDPARARQNTPQGNMGSRWGRHCSHFYLEYAQKNLPPSIRDSGQLCDYTDILTSLGCGECYGKGHEHTRTKDRRNKEELLKYITSLGIYTGSEHLQGYAVPYMAYSKGGSIVSSGDWIMQNYPVPLWNLVFHDCYLAYDGVMSPSASSYLNFAGGCMNQMFFNWPRFQAQKDGPWDDLRVFWDFQRQTGREELVSFAFSEELNGPYAAKYGDGSVAMVNPTLEKRTIDGQVLKPESMVLQFGGRRAEVTATRPEWQIR